MVDVVKLYVVIRVVIAGLVVDHLAVEMVEDRLWKFIRQVGSGDIVEESL